jgi:CheY-like chemotaxis protein
MGSEELSRSDEYNQGAINEKLYNGKMRLIERYLIIAMAMMICAILLMTFKLILLAGCFIIASASLGIVIYRNIDILNRKYRESFSALNRTDQKKDKLITDFSHKIREPLNNLVITGEMFSETDPTPKQKVLLDTVLASIKSMVSTVNELTMHSAENMSHDLRKQIRFNILSTIEHVTELYRFRDKAGIVFTVSMKEGAETECIGDPVVIKQILLDLIARIERQYPGRSLKVSIRLEVEKGTGDDGLLIIKIITDADIDLIDEKSQEGNHVIRLITFSKGRYSREIIKDESVLTIQLGIKLLPPDTGRKIPSTKIEELIRKEKTRKELKDIRVLLVEDNIINQKITLLTLQPLVQGIDTAINGKEALEMFGSNNYDLILMDIQMPVMNGLTAIEKIRALESTTNTHVPIIAITANAMIGDKEKCMAAGADEYISKPFQPVNLVEKIKQII